MNIKNFNYQTMTTDSLDTKTPSTFDECLKNRLIKVSDHPRQAGLAIANYTPETQYGSFWNSITCSHRGLILQDGVAINNPLPKFFNLGQLYDGDSLMTKPFKVYEKLDGNCGILYWLADETPQIATRGSFTSEGATFANKVLIPKYLKFINNFDKNYTYVFEIISPVTKIVVDYGSQERLVLLAIRANDQTHELDLVDIDYPDKAKLFDGWSIETVLQAQNANTVGEGFVLLFEDGLRVKIKCTEYMRLHKIITNVNNIDIWKGKMYNTEPNQYKEWANLSDIETVMADVADEFYNWFKKVDSDIESQYETINNQIIEAYDACKDWNRGEIAKTYKQKGLTSYIFNIIDGRDNRLPILKTLRPKLATPCVVDDI
jgi:hypothetical protein